MMEKRGTRGTLNGNSQRQRVYDHGIVAWWNRRSRSRSRWWV